MSNPSDTPLFPALAEQFLLQHDMTFLNHGSFGAVPRPVFETYQRWQRELEAQPVEFLGRRLDGLLAEARQALGAFIGAPAESIVFVPNATVGVNIVARSIELKPGDEVLSTNHEYGAADRAWRFVCERAGARYINQPIGLPAERAEALVDQLWAGVTERTRLIFLSHITSPTALILPVEQICARARQAGILTLIDGAHAPGQIDLDLGAVGADFYAGNCHKWLCNQRPSGFLYARPEMRHLLQPLIVSWGWQPQERYLEPYQYMFEWTGTYNPAAFLSLPKAIEFQQQNNWREVRAACRRLLLDASRQIGELTGMAPISPDDGHWWSQMRTIPLPPCDAAAVQRRLWGERRVEVPFVRWNDRQFVRVSIQAYNSPADIERLLDGLREAI